MRIALVHPHAAPAVLGGAENLLWGLQNALTSAGNICDVVGVISPEATLAQVLESYQQWLDVDLRAYDIVISGKYPAWMATHPDHRLYLLHRLRGLYDTYPFQPGSHGSPALSGALEELRQIADAAAHPRDRARRLLDTARSRIALSDDPAITGHPGPYGRAIVHLLDGLAINSHSMRAFAAISRNVAQRAGYLPPGIQASVLYPPPHRLDQRAGDRRHLFTSSRLDRPKRVELIIRAMRDVRHDVPLLIAGHGPEHGYLDDLAATDPRIRLLGRVHDEDLLDLYAGSIAVPFVPFDEDYGLVTVEAMRSGAPVITCRDSGGPTEFVDHGVTGLVAEPDPQSLAAAINRVLDHPDEATAMGQAARRRVSDITWERVVEGLLEPSLPSTRPQRLARSAPSRPKLVVAATLPVYPPRGGGQIRIFHLYRHLAQQFDIELVTLGPPHTEPVQLALAPGLIETRIPVTPLHAQMEARLSAAANHVPVTDIIMPRLVSLTPAYRQALARAGRGATALIACHPYLMRELKAVSRGQPLWFEAQDVEISLKRRVFETIEGAQTLLRDIAEIEAEAWHAAELVFACTQADLQELEALHGVTQAHTVVAPNGVALEEFPFTPWSSRLMRRAALGLSDKRLALFMGSWHPPNVDAVETLIELAGARSDLVCCIVGSVSLAMTDRSMPDNLRLLGVVPDAVRREWLSAVDVALNPMRYGSGSNLKMLDYLASGVPVLTSPFGIRGLDIDDRLVEIDEIEAFAQAIDRLMARTDEALEHRTQAARDHVADRFAWHTIAQQLGATMAKLIGSPQQKQ